MPDLGKKEGESTWEDYIPENSHLYERTCDKVNENIAPTPDTEASLIQALMDRSIDADEFRQRLGDLRSR